jgi:TonB-linked SusC/RagA family outer membrane protein
MNTKFYSPMKSMLLLGVFLLSTLLTFAQDRRVTGKVTGSDGQGIPGVSVLLKGTQTGTSTDASGGFAISLKSGKEILLFSGVGYKSSEVKVGTQSSVNVTLADEVSALDEVIVTGYSSSNKKESTAAISTVKAKDLKAVPSGNVEQQLQGRVSGVTVISNGQPGTSSIIRVRGFGAFGGNEPLYIVDGVPVQSTDFLAPDDIETTTVLKDASSASIYGARAANGVIVYTTKKGTKKARALEISYDGLVGTTDPGKGQTMLNPQEQADWTWNAVRNTATAKGTAPDFSNVGGGQYGTGTSPVLPDYINVGGRSGVVGSVDLAAEKLKYNIDPTAGSIYQVVKANKAGTDWYGAITRYAPLTRHSLGFSGGTDASRFYIGLSAQEQAGILIYNDFKRYTFRANTEFDLSKKVRIGENLQFTYRSINGQSGGNNGLGIAGDESEILTAFRMPSIIPVYDEFGGYAGTAAKGFNNGRNPVASRDGIKDNKSFNANAFGNIYLEYDPIENLTLRTSLGGQYNNFYNYSYSRLQYENSENNASYGYGENSGYNYSYTFTNTANYKKKIGVHTVDVLAGIEALNTGAGRFMGGSGLNPFSTDPNYVTLSTVSGTGKVVNSSLISGVNFYSLFGQAKYSYKDKYFLTGVLRRDGSSRFGVNARYGTFPAVSAAWRVSAEDFMKELPFISDLKLRGGWGQMGNSNNVDPNNQYSLYSSSVGLAAYDISGSNNSVAEGFYRSRIGNPNAKWETSTTSNIGLDATLLNGKFEVAIDLWKKVTTDLLFQVPIAGVTGVLASAPSVNVASMLNQGLDIQIINRGKIGGDWKYEATLNGSFLKNEITSLSPGVNYIPGATTFRGIEPTRNQVGYSIASFFGYKVVGLFKNAEEVKGAATQAGAAPGRFRFEDIDGNGVIDAADRTNLGSPVPSFTGGLNFKVSYKAFDIETYMFGSAGNKIFNMSKWYTDFYPSFTGAAISARVKDSWTPTNTGSTTPIFEGESNFSTNTQSNSWYVEDGSYLRMQNLSVAYTLPNDILKKIGIKRAKITAATNNVFTITGYKGLDPSVGGAVDTNFGIDVGNYPLTRSFNVAVSLGF